MNLIVDVGNFKVKLAVFQENTLVSKSSIMPQTANSALEELLNKHPKIQRALIAASGSIPEGIVEFLESKLAVFVLDHAYQVPYSNAYKTPETLGLDRIALASAAVLNYPGKNVLVIDAGTCITYDFVTQDNTYLGGAISPGLHMRYMALNEFTAGLPLLEPLQHETLIGDTTATAMHSGVVLGMVAEIQGFIDRYKAQYADLTVILTGGDLLFLLDHLKNGIFANSNFLLEGLNYLLELNTLHD